MQKSFLARVLVAMFEQAQASSPPGLLRLSRLLSEDPETIERALLQLEKQGFVDAARARLTFSGLTVAVSARAALASRTLAA